MSEALEAIYDGRRVGRLHYAGDRITFVYADEWCADPDAFPVSLSMPLQRAEHRDEVVRPFISGLLPDDDEVLKRWGQRFHVSPRNPFRLLSYVGEECAGAIQFVPADRAPDWLGDSPPGGVDWLDDDEFIERIEGLLTDSSGARTLGDEGQFSLAGAQAKTALRRHPDGGRWGIPKGTTPTSHIIKPNRGDFEAFEINEHFCLQLANQLGLAAATSWTEKVGVASVIVVERYDRTTVGGRLVRVHQEDCCQALARMPQNKYENEGGPSAGELFELIREHSSRPQDDVLRLLDSLIFNYLIGGTDAHSKNYSLLIAGGGQVRLAPLYDLISILPYSSYRERKTKLAMKIGGEYLLWKIGARSWEKAAAEWKLDRDLVFSHCLSMAESMTDAAGTVVKKIVATGEAEREVLLKLKDSISERAAEMRRLFSNQ